MKIIDIKQGTEIISIEELTEAEYNMVYNPFDTTGTGYLEEDFTEELKSQYKLASDYYKAMENIDLNY